VGCHGDEGGGVGPGPTDGLSCDGPHQQHRQEGHDGHGDDGMGEVAMVVEIADAAAGRRDDVDIRSVGGQHEDSRGARSPAVQPGPAQEQAHCGVGERIHVAGYLIDCKGGGGSGGAVPAEWRLRDHLQLALSGGMRREGGGRSSGGQGRARFAVDQPAKILVRGYRA